MIPNSISLSVGLISTGFRVSVPVTFIVGTYYITWETYNDLTPAFYTPLQKTAVVINSLTTDITLTTVVNVPVGGTSLPIYFKSNFAPDSGVNFNLALNSAYPGISLS